MARYWYVAFIYPAAGLGLLIFAENPFLEQVGLLALFWPITIPLRSWLAVRRGPKKRIPAWLEADENQISIRTEAGDQARLQTKTIKNIREFLGYVLIHTNSMSYRIVPASAFRSKEDIQKLKEWIAKS